jgi:hypothetical protein
MKPTLRDSYGDRTPAGRRVSIGVSVLVLLSVGFGIGRLSSTGARAPAPALLSSPSRTAQAPAPPRGAAPDTQAGAVTAAAEADCVLGGPLVTSPAQYQAALTQILAPDKAAAAADLAQQESAQVDAQTGAVSAAAAGTRVYVSCVPLGYRVESYAAGTAAVSIWTEQIVAVEGSYAPASGYITETLHLAWSGGAWKLESSSLLDTAWAPTPRESALPQSTTLPAQMVTFAPFGSG